MSVKLAIELAKEFPFDGRQPKDSANLAALAVLADLSGRRGIDNELSAIGDDIKQEIVDSIAAIICQVMVYDAEICDTCNGTGVQCFGTSGLAEDGNAPILEPCGMCGYDHE